MGSGQERWSVFDGVKLLPATPEALMSEINTAISSLEYAKASVLLDPTSSSLSSSSSCPSKSKSSDRKTFLYDADIAEEAYRLACVALAEGKVDEALYSLKISLSKCPPDNIDAIDKIRSLISLTTRQLQRSFR